MLYFEIVNFNFSKLKIKASINIFIEHITKPQKASIDEVQIQVEETKNSSFSEISKYKNQIVDLQGMISMLIQEKQELIDIITQKNTFSQLKAENDQLK